VGLVRAWLAALAVLLAAPAFGADASPGARLADGGASSEYWDVTAVFDSGHRIFARFSISNEGPGERTAYALGQVVFPDGRVVAFQNGRTEANWRLSDDRLRIKIGSSVLDLHGPARHFEVDKNKKGIKLFLDFDGGAAPIRSWAGAPAGLHVDLVDLAVPARGSIWVRDVVEEPVALSGRVTVTHVFMDQSEFELVSRRIEPHLLVSGDGASHAYLVDVLPTKGAARRWAVIRRGDGVVLETGRFELEASGQHAAREHDYPIPEALVLTGGDLSGRIELGKRVLAHDPLDLAPSVFRWLLSFRTEPRHIWLESQVSLRWTGEGEPFDLRGAALTSIYFLNPMDDS
jgi:hypothetical protein